MRQWWNWHTRWSKKPMPKGLRVQVSPDAPKLIVVFFFINKSFKKYESFYSIITSYNELKLKSLLK